MNLKNYICTPDEDKVIRGQRVNLTLSVNSGDQPFQSSLNEELKAGYLIAWDRKTNKAIEGYKKVNNSKAHFTITTKNFSKGSFTGSVDIIPINSLFIEPDADSSENESVPSNLSELKAIFNSDKSKEEKLDLFDLDEESKVKFGKLGDLNLMHLIAFYHEKSGKTKDGAFFFREENRAEYFLHVETGEEPTLNVGLTRTSEPISNDEILWALIAKSTDNIRFQTYQKCIDEICKNEELYCIKTGYKKDNAINDHHHGVILSPLRSYAELKRLTDGFLKEKIGSLHDTVEIQKILNKKGRDIPISEVERMIEEYFKGDLANGFFAEREGILPYLEKVNGRLPQGNGNDCETSFSLKLTRPLFLELIWSYWHEEGMLVQAMNAVSLRFQNKRSSYKNQLENLAIDPLRGLNNILWGFIQDELSRLSMNRRAYEYSHHYGLALFGKAVPKMQPVEVRSKFIEGFHTLLHLCTRFYKEFDDTTIYADPFPIKNALKEVHIILSEGAHNQYGDLPWTSRVEMMITQYIFARPEMREFLGGRAMVPYQEDWMDRVDSVKRIMGWTDTSITNFSNLAYWGERILLSIRFGNWNDTASDREQAANWASYWRNDIQSYIHAYRTATGVDLSNEKVDYAIPSVHLLKRLKEQIRSTSKVGA